MVHGFAKKDRKLLCPILKTRFLSKNTLLLASSMMLLREILFITRGKVLSTIAPKHKVLQKLLIFLLYQCFSSTYAQRLIIEFQSYRTKKFSNCPVDGLDFCIRIW